MVENEPHLLQLPDERIKLLKAGFTEKEIEQLFLVLNEISIVELNIN